MQQTHDVLIALMTTKHKIGCIFEPSVRVRSDRFPRRNLDHFKTAHRVRHKNRAFMGVSKRRLEKKVMLELIGGLCEGDKQAFDGLSSSTRACHPQCCNSISPADAEEVRAGSGSEGFYAFSGRISGRGRVQWADRHDDQRSRSRLQGFVADIWGYPLVYRDGRGKAMRISKDSPTGAKSPPKALKRDELRNALKRALASIAPQVQRSPHPAATSKT